MFHCEIRWNKKWSSNISSPYFMLTDNRNQALRITVTGAESEEKCAKSVKEDFCAFLLIVFGVMPVVILGWEASSLFILKGVLQSNVFGVLVNAFLVAPKIF